MPQHVIVTRTELKGLLHVSELELSALESKYLGPLQETPRNTFTKLQLEVLQTPVIKRHRVLQGQN